MNKNALYTSVQKEQNEFLSLMRLIDNKHSDYNKFFDFCSLTANALASAFYDISKASLNLQATVI